MPDKTYLGDSVYVDFSGYGITLTTENGYGPTNTIFLEPEGIVSLEEFLKVLKAELQA